MWVSDSFGNGNCPNSSIAATSLSRRCGLDTVDHNKSVECNLMMELSQCTNCDLTGNSPTSGSGDCLDFQVSLWTCNREWNGGRPTQKIKIMNDVIQQSTYIGKKCYTHKVLHNTLSCHMSAGGVHSPVGDIPEVKCSKGVVRLLHACKRFLIRSRYPSNTGNFLEEQQWCNALHFMCTWTGESIIREQKEIYKPDW